MSADLTAHELAPDDWAYGMSADELDAFVEWYLAGESPTLEPVSLPHRRMSDRPARAPGLARRRR